MASMIELRTRIKGVEETLKITNAMYLISSSKLKKARKQLKEVEPYFDRIAFTISDILHHSPVLDHPYLRTHKTGNPKIGYLVITGDKGLAGAYHPHILNLAQDCIAQHDNATLFVVGQVGRAHFLHKKIPIATDFLYTAQEPTLLRAREIGSIMLKLFESEALDEIDVLYTRMLPPFQMQPRMFKLLPLDRVLVDHDRPAASRYCETLVYLPSVDTVMNNLVASRVNGMVFGALVQSFCCEQSARMTAMEASTKNAKEMIHALSLLYHRARQSAITQEIAEISGGRPTS